MNSSRLTSAPVVLVVAFALGMTLPTATFAADEGKLAFNNRCRTCHTVRANDNRLGPSLHGIIGKKAGSSTGYRNYSQSLANSRIVWDEVTLDKFIESPDSVVPGNNMKPYPGLPDADVRKQIIDYLKSQSEDQGASQREGEA